MSADDEEYPEDFGDESTPAPVSAAAIESSSPRERHHHVASPQKPQPHDIDDPELVSSLVQFAANGEEAGVRAAGTILHPFIHPYHDTDTSMLLLRCS
jgi:hypothetical protein